MRGRLAGFAGTFIICLVNGFIFRCALVAGLRTTLILSSPGTTNRPGPFLPRSFLISSVRLLAGLPML